MSDDTPEDSPNTPSWLVMAPVEDYIDRSSGEVKSRWIRVGAIFREGGRPAHMRLDSLPTNRQWDGYLRIIPYNRGQGNQTWRSKARRADPDKAPRVDVSGSVSDGE